MNRQGNVPKSHKIKDTQLMPLQQLKQISKAMNDIMGVDKKV